MARFVYDAAKDAAACKVGTHDDYRTLVTAIQNGVNNNFAMIHASAVKRSSNMEPSFNHLPEEVTSVTSRSIFQRRFKTFLFRKSFPDIIAD